MSLRSSCKNCGELIGLITKGNDYMGREIDIDPHWVHMNYFYSRQCQLVAEPNDNS